MKAAVCAPVQFVPATPNAIAALLPASGIDWVAVSAVALAIAIPAISYCMKRSENRRNAAIGAHAEYSTQDIGVARQGALKFVRNNRHPVFTKTDLRSLYDSGAEDLYTLMRFFDRQNILIEQNIADEGLWVKLLGGELAWWYGFAFEARSQQSNNSRTLPGIERLAARCKSIYPDWDAAYCAGQGA